MERNMQRGDDVPLFDPVSVVRNNDDDYSFMASFSATMSHDNEQGFDIPEAGFDGPEPGKNKPNQGRSFFHGSPPPAKKSRMSDKKLDSGAAKSTPFEERSPYREEFNRKAEPKQRLGNHDQRASGSHSSESLRQRAMTEQEVDKGSKQEKTYRDIFNDWLEDQHHELSEQLDELQDLRDVNGRYLEAFTIKARQVNDIYQSLKKEKMQILQTLDKIRSAFDLRRSPSASADSEK